MSFLIERIKQILTNPESVSIANIISGILIYSLDNYMQIGAAISFFATTIVAILTKYSKYKQDKLDRIQIRKVEMMRLELELRHKEEQLSKLKTNN